MNCLQLATSFIQSSEERFKISRVPVQLFTGFDKLVQEKGKAMKIKWRFPVQELMQTLKEETPVFAARYFGTCLMYTSLHEQILWIHGLPFQPNHWKSPSLLCCEWVLIQYLVTHGTDSAGTKGVISTCSVDKSNEKMIKIVLGCRRYTGWISRTFQVQIQFSRTRLVKWNSWRPFNWNIYF